MDPSPMSTNEGMHQQTRVWSPIRDGLSVRYGRDTMSLSPRTTCLAESDGLGERVADQAG
jgi:hypothetical protein